MSKNRNNELAELAARILGMPDAVEDAKWGPVNPLREDQADLFRDFVKKHEELEARIKRDDTALHEEYHRKMNLTLALNDRLDGPIREFQIIELGGRKYIRWEIQDE